MIYDTFSTGFHVLALLFISRWMSSHFEYSILTAFATGIGIVVAMRVFRWRDYLCGVDANLAAVDRYMLGNIIGVTVLKDEVTPEHIASVLRSRLLIYKEFNSIVVCPKWTWPYWKRCKVIDLERDHIEVIDLVDPSSKIELEEFVDKVQGTPLNIKKPLWKFYLIRKYKGGSVIIMYCSHILGDGVPMSKMLFTLNLEDHFKDDATFKPTTRSKKAKKPTISIFSSILAALSTTIQVFTVPLDAEGPMKSAIHVTRTVLKWSHPMDIGRFKAVGRREGATVNDVMLSCLYGAIRKCLVGSVSGGADHPLLQGKIHAQMVCWVALRPLDNDSMSGTEAYNTRLHGQLGNKIGTIMLPLLVHVADPVKRLRRVQEITKKLKQSLEPIVSYLILNYVG